MGTFHQGKSDLHGITVVVETSGPELYVGRCDDVTERGVILNDADVHREGDETPREKYLERAARFGIWKKFDRILIPNDAVTGIRRLGELA